MSRVKNKNTGLEVRFRKILWERGLRYRLGFRLPGKPDLVFISARVAVFIDGCFWHGCPIHGSQPKTNISFWSKKLNKNKQRDQQVNEELAMLGWLVVRFWEHEITKDADRCANDLIETIKRRRTRGTPITAK